MTPNMRRVEALEQRLQVMDRVYIAAENEADAQEKLAQAAAIYRCDVQLIAILTGVPRDSNV